MNPQFGEDSPEKSLDSRILRNFMKINTALEEKRNLRKIPSQSSELTIGSGNKMIDFTIDPLKIGNRSSVMSDYSGIIQQVDIDTIKYVSHDMVNASDKNDINDGVPMRSLRRFSVDAAKINRITSIPQIKSPSGSPSKRVSASSPPKTPLPPLRRTSSGSSSTKSLKLHSQLDDLMKDVSDVQSELELGGKEIVVNNTQSRQSFSSTGNDSFYTADEAGLGSSTSFHNNGIQLEQAADSSEETPLIQKDRVQSMSTVMDLKPEPETEPALEKKHRSHRKHKHHRRSHRKKNRHSSDSNESGTKHVNSFSYDSLSRLLDSTDGIIIGQEFSSLDIPTDEKFLIDRVVDSISRITANMVINPDTQNETSNRLEKVLALLENFD